MGTLSRKLRNFTHGIAHWCPGCEQAHVIYLSGDGPRWTWDGDVEAPTVAPSVRCFTTYDENHGKLPDGQQRTLCHYFLKAGKIEFCSDSAHSLAGQTIELPDFPSHWGGFDEENT